MYRRESAWCGDDGAHIIPRRYNALNIDILSSCQSKTFDYQLMSLPK